MYRVSLLHLHTTNAHRFCGTQPTTSATLLSIQLMIASMMPGNASAAFMPNFPRTLAKTLSLFLIYSFKPFPSLDGGLHTAPPAVPSAPPPPGSDPSTRTLIAIPLAKRMEAIVMSCS